MFAFQKWKEITEWLIENKDELSKHEKDYWIEQLSEQNEKVLELWSDQLELLDEVKDKLLADAPLEFKNKQENLKGISFFELGLFSRAIEVLKVELTNTKQPSRVYLYLGFSYLYLNKGKQAKEHLLNVIYRSHDPLEKHFALLGLGLQSGREDDIEQAITYFEKAEPLLFNADVVYNLGICYLLLHMPNEALPYFKKVVETGEDVGEAYYWLGKCYMDSGDRTKAMETWYNAIHEFDTEELLLSLAVEFEEKGLFTCAIYCYERLENLGADNAIVLHGLSWNYGLMDEKEKAKRGFTELLENNPKNENAWISYLWLLNKWEDHALIEIAKEKVHSEGLKNPLLKQLINQPNI